VIIEPRVAIGGAEATPRRIGEAELTLDGSALNAETFAAAAMPPPKLLIHAR
jgi:CO/xanthine dehydrogenase FAD-binding subunit